MSRCTVAQAIDRIRLAIKHEPDYGLKWALAVATAAHEKGLPIPLCLEIGTLAVEKAFGVRLHISIPVESLPEGGLDDEAEQECVASDGGSECAGDAH
jgi:hypothetical protein